MVFLDVRLNGEFLGLFSFVEMIDQTFLEVRTTILFLGFLRHHYLCTWLMHAMTHLPIVHDLQRVGLAPPLGPLFKAEHPGANYLTIPCVRNLIGKCRSLKYTMADLVPILLMCAELANLRWDVLEKELPDMFKLRYPRDR